MVSGGIQVSKEKKETHMQSWTKSAKYVLAVNVGQTVWSDYPHMYLRSLSLSIVSKCHNMKEKIILTVECIEGLLGGPSTFNSSSLLRCSKDVFKYSDYIHLFIPWRGGSHHSSCVVVKRKTRNGSLFSPSTSGFWGQLRSLSLTTSTFTHWAISLVHNDILFLLIFAPFT